MQTSHVNIAKKCFLFYFSLLGLMACSQKPTKNFKTSIHMSTNETITLGSGCFWCTEAIFQQLKGVISVKSGYSGGHIENPSYEQVCDKNTGHAEVCQIIFDTTQIKLDEILEVFWKTHDPTTPNQQGNDIGPQYRSVVFYHNEDQKKLAKQYIKVLDASGAWTKPIITEVSAFTKFYPAESYHQNYYNNNTNQGYCKFVIGPKLEKFEKVFKDKLKKPSSN